MHISVVILTILLAFHIAVHKEQPHIAVPNDGAPLCQLHRAVGDVRFHTITGNSKGKVCIGIGIHFIVIVILAERRRGQTRSRRGQIQRNHLFLRFLRFAFYPLALLHPGSLRLNHQLHQFPAVVI